MSSYRARPRRVRGSRPAASSSRCVPLSRPASPWSVARAVFATELLGLRRDRRAMFVALALPLVLVPLVFLGQAWIEHVSRESLSTRSVRVLCDLRLTTPEVALRLRELLQREQPIDLVDVDAGDLARLEPEIQKGTPQSEVLEREAARRLLDRGGDCLLIARRTGEIPDWGLRLYFDESDESSEEARARVDRVLDRLHGELAQGRLDSVAASDPVHGAAHEAGIDALHADSTGGALRSLFPLIAVVVLLTGGSYAALSAFAGEREGGTLETLLVQPVPAISVAAGKFAAVLAASVATLVLHAGSVLACIALGLGSLSGVSLEVGASASVADVALRWLAGAFVFLPAAVTVCAALCFVCARARTFREGQHSLLPLMLVAIVPMLFAAQEDVRLDGVLAMIPLAGPSLALRDAMRGELDLGIAAWMFAVNTLWAWLALREVARSLDAEKILRTPRTAGEDRARRTQSRYALRWAWLAVFLAYVVGGTLQSRDFVGGVLITQWVILPAIAWCSLRGTARRAHETLHDAAWLHRPVVRHVLGALCLVPVVAHLSQAILAWQSDVLPLPVGLDAAPFATELAGFDATTRFALLVVTPAICEELLFRGALLSGLRRDRSPLACVLWQALLFGAVHASIYRFLPTALVGAVLAAVALRTRSLLVPIAVHAAYNAWLVQGALPVAASLEASALLGALGFLLLARPAAIRVAAAR